MSPRAPHRALAGLAAGAVLSLAASAPARADAPARGKATVADYLGALEAAGLIDIASGSAESLAAETRRAEELLREGDAMSAAIALYGVVESPAYRVLSDLVEYANAEYDLAVSLAESGAYDSALRYFERSLERGPDSIYFAPANRKVIDIALETRAYRDVLGRLDAIEIAAAVPPGVAGDRAYLRGRALYDEGDLRAAEAELAKVNKDSRLYSSALYLRGVIRTRQGRFSAAAEALCEVAGTAEDDEVAFVVDGRYFELKDLARLGLGRIAHEVAEYDDAYYHYFQVPEDSEHLAEALFEAAWSMYQKRELATARWLVREFLDTFPSSPLVPEARLLAGYIDLADCEFARAEETFDRLVADMTPIVRAIERARADPRVRRQLLSRALSRWRSDAGGEDGARRETPARALDQVLALLRLDPGFVRLHDAIAGLRRAAGAAPHVARTWRALANRMGDTDVAEVADPDTLAQEDAARASALARDVRRLRDHVDRARANLRRGSREGTLAEDEARAEAQRLEALRDEVSDLLARAERASAAADDRVSAEPPPSLAPLVGASIAGARELGGEAKTLLGELQSAADGAARRSLAELHRDTRRVLDKAKLGKIDTVIGQKRKLEIEVQDLAAGRYPPELHGRMWEDGLIADDEEYWPHEGEYWADEYEGWR